MYPWLIPAYQGFCQRIASGKLHHGILLLGNPGLGKTELALALGRFLLCRQPVADLPCGQCQSCLLLAAESHPDLHQVVSEKQIGVDQIRQAISQLSGTAQLSGAKVLIIYQADSMTEAAANALLKTLEEPTNKTFLILTSSNKNRLLPTILSRCEKNLLPAPSLQQTSAWLSEQGVTADPGLIKSYQGSPLLALAAAQDPEGLKYHQFQQAMKELPTLNPAELAEKWQDHSAQVLKWLQHFLADKLKQATPQQHDPLWQVYRQSQQSTQAIQNPGVNKSLLLGRLLKQLQRCH